MLQPEPITEPVITKADIVEKSGGVCILWLTSANHNRNGSGIKSSVKIGTGGVLVLISFGFLLSKHATPEPAKTAKFHSSGIGSTFFSFSCSFSRKD